MEDRQARLLGHLTYLYGGRHAAECLSRLEAVVSRYRGKVNGRRAAGLDQDDVMLITYPDQVQATGLPPLQVLADFCREHLSGVVSGLHILPFYPSSSDDGFSVMDYRAVDRALGDWEDIAALGREFHLMFDAVINHASARGPWFQGFLRGDPTTSSYFITEEGDPDLSPVVRPRTSPLLTEFETAEGPKRVWTTFSADQPDLNYANPDVLLEMMDVLLGYCSRGADFLRLDAVGYLWKELGTACIHLPQTHRIIQLVRAVLDDVAPHVLLVTETNVPHAENLSYFGDGWNEAQLVYNFALPPLVLHAFLRQDSRWLRAWASGLSVPSPRTTFLNFLASHDGIGLNAVHGILPEAEIGLLVREIQARGGLVSFKDGPDGGPVGYELNLNFLDALTSPSADSTEAAALDRFVAAHAILLSLRGVPAVYFHSLFGSRGWPEGVGQTGRNRTINRQKLARAQIEEELADPGSCRAQVYRRLTALLRARAASAAFGPIAEQQILDCGDAVFGVLRFTADDTAWAVCLHNLTGRGQSVDLGSFRRGEGEPWVEILTGGIRAPEERERLDLQPYEVRWFASARAPGAEDSGPPDAASEAAR